MGHVVVFLNVAILCVGAAIAVGFLGLYRSWRTAVAFWQLMLFLAFTATMSVAAVEAYIVVNVGFGAAGSRLFASLILVGSAAMLLALPFGARARSGMLRGRRFTAFWVLLAIVPVVAAVGLFFATTTLAMMLTIGLAFLPFVGSIIYSVGLETRESPSVKPWVPVLVLFSLAALEITWILRHPPQGGYLLVTLPIAYLYLCWSSWKGRARPEDGDLSATISIPDALVSEKGLTDREAQMARGILEGRSTRSSRRTSASRRTRRATISTTCTASSTFRNGWTWSSWYENTSAIRALLVGKYHCADTVAGTPSRRR